MAKDKPTKLRPDVAEVAFRVFQEAIGERAKTVPLADRTEKNPVAQKRGRKGGKAGGPARADALSDRQRRKIAKKAARKRWGDERAG
jgi:hypothetical protein